MWRCESSQAFSYGVIVHLLWSGGRVGRFVAFSQFSSHSQRTPYSWVRLWSDHVPTTNKPLQNYFVSTSSKGSWGGSMLSMLAGFRSARMDHTKRGKKRTRVRFNQTTKRRSVFILVDYAGRKRQSSWREHSSGMQPGEGCDRRLLTPPSINTFACRCDRTTHSSAMFVFC